MAREIVKVSARININIRQISRFQASLKNEGARSNALDKWGTIYLDFLWRRFKRMSQGGWHPLKRSSEKRKREAKAGRKAILMDTLQLYQALRPIKGNPPPGQLRKISPRSWTIKVGYGGQAKHKYSKRSIAQIATIHNEGRGRVRQRVIVIPPPKTILTKVGRIAKDTLDALIARAR